LKVTLINPAAEYVSDRYPCSPPLGLATIAAVLKTKDIDVEIIDLAASGQTICPKDMLPLPGTDVVGISITMTQRFPQAIAISRVIKKADKDMPVVFGGNHPTFMCKQILQTCSSVDFIVLYEGDYTFPKLLDVLEHGKSLADVNGIAYRDKDEKIVVAPQAERVKDIDALPMPARHLLPMKSYEKWSAAGGIVTGRGCPYRCTFCSTSAFFGHEVRLNSAERIVKEIEYLMEKYHIRDIRFADDLFTVSPARVNALCNMIIERNLDINWGGFKPSRLCGCSSLEQYAQGWMPRDILWCRISFSAYFELVPKTSNS